MQPPSHPEQQTTGQTVVPGQRVRLSNETAMVGIPHPDCASDPVVELIRDGELIRAIDVICTCGRRIRLTCEYE